MQVLPYLQVWLSLCGFLCLLISLPLPLSVPVSPTLPVRLSKHSKPLPHIACAQVFIDGLRLHGQTLSICMPSPMPYWIGGPLSWCAERFSRISSCVHGLCCEFLLANLFRCSLEGVSLVCPRGSLWRPASESISSSVFGRLLCQ